jgi:biopolymer transport protein ExbB
MMKGYATSRFRIVFLAMMLAAAGIVAGSSFAQDAGGTPAASPKGASTFQLVFSHLDDPIFWIIGTLSIIGLTLIIQGFLTNRSEVLMPEATTNRIREMIGARQFKEVLEFTENDPSFVSRAINAALKRAPDFQLMKEGMETAIGEQTAEQFRKIEYLNIIGNLGPLLGLLGTVYGMIVAFSAMQAEGGSASPATLAGGISKALAHTFLGLMLAVPCLAAFGVLRTMVDRLTVRGALVAEELLLMIKPADSRSTSSSPGERATPQPGLGSSAAPSVGRKPASAPPAFQG